MQKIQIFSSDGDESSAGPAPEWNASIIVVGRIPCIGELVDIGSFDRRMEQGGQLEVVQVVHGLDVENGTLARVILLD